MKFLSRFAVCLSFAVLFSSRLWPAGDFVPVKISSSVPWKVGEKFTFSINWGLVNGGEATIGVEDLVDLKPSTGHAQSYSCYHIVAGAVSNSFIDVFYKVRDKNESWLDANVWLSHRFEQHNQEGKFILDQVVRYDWKNLRFHNEEDVRGRALKVEDGNLTVPAVDTLSSLYYVRARDFKVGDTFTMEVHSGRTWPLIVKVLKREKVRVPAGEFDCYLVEPFLRERGLFIQKGKKLQVWLTADWRKLPVMMKAEIFIGHVSAVLTKIE